MDAMSGRGELGDRGLVADFYGLGERAEYRTERTGADGADGADSIILGGIQDWADWGGRVDAADAADYGILDGADWGGRGGQGSLGQACQWTRRTDQDAHVQVDWPLRVLRAEGISGVLSTDADCGVIWLHTPGIHIRFFGAHVVVRAQFNKRLKETIRTWRSSIIF